MANNRDECVTLSRVIAILSIIFSHLCIVYNWVSIRSIIIGVPLFIFISGYLYGSKDIGKTSKFIYSRWKKIILPGWIFAALSFALSGLLLSYKPTKIDLLMYLFNLQGLDRLYIFSSYNGFKYCGILWFVTVIFICYLLIPVVKKTEKCNRRFKLILISVLFIVSLLLSLIGIRTHYFWVFFIGYYLSKHKIQFNLKLLIGLSVFCLLLWGIRIISRRFIDGSLLYDEIIANYSLDILAIVAFAIIKYTYLKYEVLVDKITSLKIIKWIDTNSFYIYMTHYLFFAGVFQSSFVTNDLFIATIYILVLTIPATIMMKKLCEFIIRVMP